MRFTDTSIRRLRPRESRYEAFEDGSRGFGIRVSPSGRKTWISTYRSRTVRHGRGYGRLQRISHGEVGSMTLAEARLKHAELRAGLERGKDPAAEKRAARQQKRAQVMTSALEVGDTVEGLVEVYVKRVLRTQRSGGERERLLRREIVPRVGAVAVTELDRKTIAAIGDEIVDRGSPIVANRVCSALKSMIAFAVDRGIVEHNVAIGMKPPSREESRSRVLSDEEIRVLWTDLENEDIFYRTGIRLLLTTGARKAEVTQARWSEVQGNAIVIPASRVKTQEDHVVPISSLARELLNELPRADDHMFPGKSGGPLNGTTWNRLTARVIQRTSMVPFTIHDLRRTCRTEWSKLRIDLDVAEALLGHKFGSRVQQTYNRHDLFVEKADALERWGDRLQQIIAEQDARVLSMTRSC